MFNCWPLHILIHLKMMVSPIIQMQYLLGHLFHKTPTWSNLIKFLTSKFWWMKISSFYFLNWVAIEVGNGSSTVHFHLSWISVPQCKSVNNIECDMWSILDTVEDWWSSTLLLSYQHINFLLEENFKREIIWRQDSNSRSFPPLFLLLFHHSYHSLSLYILISLLEEWSKEARSLCNEGKFL